MKFPPAFLLPLLVLGVLPSSTAAPDEPDLSNHDQKINYALGLDIVTAFKLQEVDIDLKAFAAGMTDALAGKPLLDPEQKKAAMQELADEASVKEKARRKIAAIKNLADGEAFLAANATKDGVKILDVIAPDGSKAQLQYQILKSGSGPSPTDTDGVEVHYVGTFIDGREFDSSVKRNTPATFGMHDVIPGWTAALKKMKEGDKWRLFIPAKLAYGEYGLPQMGPNSTLIYELELLDVYQPQAAPAASASPAGAQ